MNRKLFRTPYVGEKRRCFIYVSPISKDNLVKVAAPPATLIWDDFMISKDLEKNKDNTSVWLEIKKDNPDFKEYIN